MSHAAIYAMEVEVEGPVAVAAAPPQGVRMDDVPGKSGTPFGLAFRAGQFVCAIIAVAVMSSSDFADIPAFSFLVAASALLCLWSLSMMILDAYALLVKRLLRHYRLFRVITVGDAIIGALLFTAASASGGSSGTYSLQIEMCGTNPCTSYATSTVFAYFSLLALFFTFFLNCSSAAARGAGAAGAAGGGAGAATGAGGAGAA
ncbi:hypothetical protein BRADI_3g40390v3 [Brachypodium distachyon]|uniref:CASP-like protein n=1 Tax=Brachypodium distachyon TaxID=15368 RepID=I1I8L7_BRADI|nr:hypothetical protein BRADI_3g40390v3 [Brachypodium distachyon]